MGTMARYKIYDGVTLTTSGGTKTTSGVSIHSAATSPGFSVTVKAPSAGGTGAGTLHWQVSQDGTNWDSTTAAADRLIGTVGEAYKTFSFNLPVADQVRFVYTDTASITDTVLTGTFQFIEDN